MWQSTMDGLQSQKHSPMIHELICFLKQWKKVLPRSSLLPILTQVYRWRSVIYSKSLQWRRHAELSWIHCETTRTPIKLNVNLCKFLQKATCCALPVLFKSHLIVKQNRHVEVSSVSEQTAPPTPTLPWPNPLCGWLASASHILSFRLPPWTWAEQGLCSPAERSKRWEPSSSSTLVWNAAKISEAAAAHLALHSQCGAKAASCAVTQARDAVFNSN